ncbi:MAG: phosphomannomutase/phosphoglucomutase [Thiotrichales bacterium]
MSANALSPAIFRQYDIRGIVDESLTTEGMYLIGRGFGAELAERGESRIVLARDARPSSKPFSQSLTNGLLESGTSVFDLSAIATPVAHFAAIHLGIANTAVVTGSHNPSNYNGVKLSAGYKPFHRDQLQELYQRIAKNQFCSGRGDITPVDITEEYEQSIITRCKLDRPLRIALDCGNGIAGITAVDTLKKLGCDLVELYCDPQGSFPNHHPNPSDPENLLDLQQTVIDQKLDLGIALDGDGDRMGLVDSSGKIIWPDRQMMLFAQAVLKKHPGQTIVFDVKSSRHLAEVIEANGGHPLMFKSGSSLLREKMQTDNLLFGGELSGHLFFRDRWFGFDDGLYSAARMLELLSQTDLSSAEVFGALPDSVNTPELNIPFSSEKDLNDFMSELLTQPLDQRVIKAHRIDGLRLDYKNGWALIRSSNTTPTLSIRFEADDATALREIQKFIADFLHGVRPDLALPFLTAPESGMT